MSITSTNLILLGIAVMIIFGAALVAVAVINSTSNEAMNSMPCAMPSYSPPTIPIGLIGIFLVFTGIMGFIKVIISLGKLNNGWM